MYSEFFIVILVIFGHQVVSENSRDDVYHLVISESALYWVHYERGSWFKALQTCALKDAELYLPNPDNAKYKFPSVEENFWVQSDLNAPYKHPSEDHVVEDAVVPYVQMCTYSDSNGTVFICACSESLASVCKKKVNLN